MIVNTPMKHAKGVIFGPTLVAVFTTTVVLLTSVHIPLVAASEKYTEPAVVEHSPSTTEEYCAGELFQARCANGRNEVIIILTANYGRMKAGRCVKDRRGPGGTPQDPLFLGCSADVKHVLDQQCSGRSECNVPVADHTFNGVEPCHAELKLYLEASYTCVADCMLIEVAAENRHCTIPLTGEPQHIVGGVRSGVSPTGVVGCGTASQPWSVEALAGQRIEVNLIEFSSSEHGGAQDHLLQSTCRRQYGHVIDKSARRNVTICGDSRSSDILSRTSYVSMLYRSFSNHVHVQLNRSIGDAFIIRIAAVGCSDLAPPSDEAWLKRVDDQITIGCYMSRQTWHLNCVNGVWTGTVGVCSSLDNYSNHKIDNREIVTADGTSPEKDPLLPLMVAVAIAGVTVCCLVICVGVVCLRRQSKEHRLESKTLQINDNRC